MDQVINSILPLALLVAIGAALLRLRFFDAAFRKGLDRLVYWIALPALIVHVLAHAGDAPGSDELAQQAVRMAGAMMATTTAVAGLAWGVGWALRLPRPSLGVFTQASLRGNLAFVGLPVITFATGGDTAVIAKAALVFAPTVILFNVLGVVALVAAQHRLDWSLPWRMTKSLVANPFLIACGLGLVIWQLGVRLPVPIDTTLDLLGKPAGPLALISLGGALVIYPVGRHAATAALATLFKCGIGPALAWLITAWMGVDGADRQVVLIYAACPTAVASYVLATQLKGDPALAAATIVLSTLASGVALGVVLGIT